ncbi:MAG: type II toxin-antitoxin system VapB family antitoxin [Exilibacterium sp.]
MSNAPQHDQHFTVSIFRNGSSRAIRLPRAFDPEGVDQMEVTREGDKIILKPVRPTWDSFWARAKIEDIEDFLRERPDMIEPGSFELTDDDLEGRE